MTDNKQRISELKAAIEQRRVQRSMAMLTQPASAQTALEPDAMEESAKAQIEQVIQNLNRCDVQLEHLVLHDPSYCDGKCLSTISAMQIVYKRWQSLGSFRTWAAT